LLAKSYALTYGMGRPLAQAESVVEERSPLPAPTPSLESIAEITTKAKSDS
ncbi:MAG: hypothetical protein HC840_18880, partial [Leptolyngbyaceae cyanobacterium RM2_2_4]|nr:hypothetical protein [Leptolyngbyaceae cyanobacterium RM2_2_4]